jgi:RNA polymerase sigma factor (sigma-70 family)
VASSDLYSAHAETIESALAHACRVHRLAPDVADEFCSWARVRLLDNDQAILRKFQHRSAIRTFLITVVQRLFLDWRNAEWGKWRPTADARRLGDVGIELERLVLRDQLTYDEAVQTLVARDVATRDQCDTVWAQLPRRPRRKRADEAEVEALASPLRASDAVEDEENSALAHGVSQALTKALAALPPGDQVILQMRYWSGQTVARIATLTGENQKALYRRFERLGAELRRCLEADGVSGDVLQTITGRFGDIDAEALVAVESVASGNSKPRPSTPTSTGGEHA